MDLVTNNRVQWHPMGSPYERFVFPDFTYEVPNSFKAYEAKLCNDFPKEKDNINSFLRRVRAAQSWGIRWFVSKTMPELMGRCLTAVGRSLALQTTGEVLQPIQDAKLKAILAAQWPDMGTPPNSSAFVFQAMVAAHYAEGAYYPVGGAGGIAAAAVDLFARIGRRVPDQSSCGRDPGRKGGGPLAYELDTNHPVSTILRR